MRYFIRAGKVSGKGSYLSLSKKDKRWVKTSYRLGLGCASLKEAKQLIKKSRVSARVVRVMSHAEAIKSAQTKVYRKMEGFMASQRAQATNPKDGVGFPSVVVAYYMYMEKWCREEARKLT